MNRKTKRIASVALLLMLTFLGFTYGEWVMGGYSSTIQQMEQDIQEYLVT